MSKNVFLFMWTEFGCIFILKLKLFYQLSCTKYLVDLPKLLTHAFQLFQFWEFSCIISPFSLSFFFSRTTLYLVVGFPVKFSNFLLLPNANFWFFFIIFSKSYLILFFISSVCISIVLFLIPKRSISLPDCFFSF